MELEDLISVLEITETDLLDQFISTICSKLNQHLTNSEKRDFNFINKQLEILNEILRVCRTKGKIVSETEQKNLFKIFNFGVDFSLINNNSTSDALVTFLGLMPTLNIFSKNVKSSALDSIQNIFEKSFSCQASTVYDKNILKLAEKCIFLGNTEISNLIFILLKNRMLPNSTDLCDFISYIHLFGNAAKLLLKSNQTETVMTNIVLTVENVFSELKKIINITNKSDHVTKGLKFIEFIFEIYDVLQTVESLDDLKSKFENLVFQNYGFWSLFQNGISHKEASTRKLCIILLRKSVLLIENLNKECVVNCPNFGNKSFEISSEIFFFNPKDSILIKWKQFLSICETLDENQIHVIRPIFMKFEMLFAADSNKSKILQISWMFCLLRRMFTHESKLINNAKIILRAVQKEGLLFCLELDQTKYKIMNNIYSLEFVCQDFVELLRDENLYNVPAVINNQISKEAANCENLPFKLQQFLVCCYDNYHDETNLLKQFIFNVSKHSWSSVSLVYVCESLNHFPKTEAWTAVEVFALRNLITTCIATHHPVLRKVIVRLLVSCAIKFTQPGRDNILDVVKIIHLCIRDKAITRNSPLWNKIATWVVANIQNLTSVTPTTSINKYLLKWFNDITSNTETINETSLPDITCMALITLLSADGFHHGKDAEMGRKMLSEILQNCLTNIEKAVTHIYTSQIKVFYSVCFIKDIFMIFNTTLDSKENKSDPTKECLTYFSTKLYSGIIEYISRKFPIICQSLSNLRIYLSLMDEMLKLTFQSCSIANKNKLTALLIAMVTSVFKTSLNFVKKLNNLEKITLEGLDKLIASLFATRWCCGAICEFNLRIDSSVMLQIKGFFNSLDLQGKLISLKRCTEIPNKTWGLKMGEYLTLQWSFVGYSFKFKLNTIDPILAISYVSDIVEIVNGGSLITLFEAASCLLNEIFLTSSLQLQSTQVINCLQILWKTTYDLINSSLFRILFQSFVSTIFQPCILSSSEGSEVLECVNQILEEIINLSKSKPGLIYPVIKSCHEYWVKEIFGNQHQNQDNKSNLSNGDLKIDLHHEKSKMLQFLHGSTEFIKSDQVVDSQANQSAYNCTKLILHCLTYVPVLTKNGKSIQQAIQFSLTLNAEIAISFYIDKEEETSLIATNLLLNLNPQNKNDFEFGNHILHQLLSLDQKTTKARSRYHFNSSHHFLKQKIWQNVFILSPFIKHEEEEFMAESLINCLAVDMQASVRHLIEWILTLAIFRFPETKKMLLDKLSSNTIKGSMHTAVCSYLTVALLLGVAWKHKYKQNELTSYYLELLDLAIPWCMTQHFSVRLYAHAVLLRIKLIFQENGEIETLNLHCPSLNRCLIFADNSLGNVVKNWMRIKENFMLFYLDPILDISLVNIFENLPRLCLMETCDIKNFESMIYTNSWIPFKSLREVLSELKPSIWVAHANNKPQQFDEMLVQPVCNTDMQKKIVTKEDNNKPKQGGLILIASLIDKTSNLGGLARTCEIFGAEKLVVNSLSCIEDKLFQSLAVTAHKWLKMEEVKIWKLEEYLLFLRSKGYQLIGTEQTEQSKNLADFRFPEKCALLLGSEKEGIHPNLLRLLDCCIEIPQVGVVRSLNVHVSGAIAVWEFSKQNIFNSSKTTES